MAVMLQVNFEYTNMSPELHAANGAAERATPYCFASRADAEAYLAGPIVARITSTPTIANLTTQIYEITEGPSQVTHAPVPFLAVAAE